LKTKEVKDRPLRISKELTIPEKKLKDEEEIDEETLYSFRKAQMFFAAKTQSTFTTTTATTTTNTKKITKQ